mgnify:CR=1 FL=1
MGCADKNASELEPAISSPGIGAMIKIFGPASLEVALPQLSSPLIDRSVNDLHRLSQQYSYGISMTPGTCRTMILPRLPGRDDKARFIEGSFSLHSRG